MSPLAIVAGLAVFLFVLACELALRFHRRAAEAKAEQAEMFHELTVYKGRLSRIAEQATPGMNATVARMVKIARGEG